MVTSTRRVWSEEDALDILRMMKNGEAVPKYDQDEALRIAIEILEKVIAMTDADLKQFGGDLTPMEMYDALCGIRTVMTKEEVPNVPNAMKTLNCLIQVVKQEFSLEEQLKDRYGVNS